MKLFKFITDEETYYVFAESKVEAEGLLVSEYYPELLDDLLSDLYDVEEIDEPVIIRSYDEESFADKYMRIRNK